MKRTIYFSLFVFLLNIAIAAKAKLALTKIIYVDGSIYEGEISGSNVRHGKGKYTWINGSIYDGNWIKGEMSGYGKMTYTSGDIYEGNWLNGKVDGEGKYSCSNGDIYQGIFKTNGYFTSIKTATISYKNGNIYQGEVVENVPRNKGVLTYANGDIFEGNFVNGLSYAINYSGKYTFKNGDIYAGEFALDGTKNGKGKFIYKNGDVYEGAFVNGEMAGKGKLTYTNGKIEEGEWKGGKFAGGTTSQITVAPTTKIATVSAPQETEDQFRTNYAAAMGFAQKLDALNTYTNVVMATSFTNEQKGALLADKVVFLIDTKDNDIAYFYLQPNSGKQITFNFDYVFPQLPPDKKEILKQRAQKSKDSFVKKKMGL